MTDRQARKLIYAVIETNKDRFNDDTLEALEMGRMAIERIEGLEGASKQFMWERDIAIEQLHELGYELGQKIEPCEDAISRADAQTEIMMSKSITAFDRDLWIRTKDAVQIIRELPAVTPSRMSKEDFIYALKTCEYTVHNGQVMYEENELIKRFEQLSSVTLKLTVDAISRDEVHKILWKAIEDLEDLPSLTNGGGGK